MKYEVSSYLLLNGFLIVIFLILLFILIRKIVRFFVGINKSLQRIERQLLEIKENNNT
ncbi:hypothetical protein [Paenibacillus sp. MSJ-34]|uniref:hypothetical protein n=1 Tax=Paenibacillus sp. MSJ-34 TaxID=2841529 RepID=UPI001C11769F|nr:hypothetical protein [Paenibacillus sp. MSJ-34]MBU5444660.1 hypothetical protein [Paenibacillus sp. MSJ-34]